MEKGSWLQDSRLGYAASTTISIFKWQQPAFFRDVAASRMQPMVLEKDGGYKFSKSFLNS